MQSISYKLINKCRIANTELIYICIYIYIYIYVYLYYTYKRWLVANVISVWRVAETIVKMSRTWIRFSFVTSMHCHLCNVKMRITTHFTQWAKSKMAIMMLNQNVYNLFTCHHLFCCFHFLKFFKSLLWRHHFMSKLLNFSFCILKTEKYTSC